MPQKKAPQSYPGLTPPVFHILLALADGERHGYAIGQDVAVQADGRLDLGPGTLHGCLKRMSRQPWSKSPTCARTRPSMTNGAGMLTVVKN